jgi:RNA polymerase sigma factor (sigma-70 family)
MIRRDPAQFLFRVSVTIFAARGILVVMGDHDFAAMYAREGEVVLVFLARRTLDAAIAADLAAETFALAFRSWPRLLGRSEEEVRAWLFTVARRQISRYLRRGRVERRAVQRLGIRLPSLHEDDVAAIEERAGLSELRTALGVELARLSLEQREALRLRVVEERSYEEVALVLGVSEQAVRARVSRGLRALAGALEPYRAGGELSR